MSKENNNMNCSDLHIHVAPSDGVVSEEILRSVKEAGIVPMSFADHTIGAAACGELSKLAGKITISRNNDDAANDLKGKK